MVKKTKKVDMLPQNGKSKDINLYISNEKTLYTQTHTHSFFEFMLITKGKLHHSVNDCQRILSENEICVI